MPQAGDNFTVTLNEAQLKWGTYRRTNTRPSEKGESYIPIPASDAKKFHIYNSNHTNKLNVLGQNLFNAYDADNGSFIDHFKAQGSSTAGGEFAKQFSISGNLKALGDWLISKDVHVGSEVKIEFTSPIDLTVKILN